LAYQHKAAGMKIRLSKNNDHDGKITRRRIYFYFYFIMFVVFVAIVVVLLHASGRQIVTGFSDAV